MAARSCDPGTGKAEEDLWGSLTSLPSVLGESQANERPCLNNMINDTKDSHTERDRHTNTHVHKEGE